MKYFENYPLLRYYFENKEDSFITVNVFIKLKILEYLEEHPTFMAPYVISTSERPDVIAYELYGDSDLHWTIYMANNILDPSEWVLSERDLEFYLKERYDNKDATAYYEKDGIEADVRAHQKMMNDSPFNTIDSDPDPDFADPVKFAPISYAQMEEIKNDSKRVIRVIRPDRITQFLRDVENKLREVS